MQSQLQKNFVGLYQGALMFEESESPSGLWLSLGSLLQWMWPKMFTRFGALVVLFASLPISIFHAYLIGKSWSPGFVFIAIFIFLLLFLCLTVASLVADAFAEFVVRMLVKVPSSKNVLHQAMYLIFSCIGLIPAGLLVVAGIGGDNFGRP